MTKQITLYTAKICPWAHRTELALAEAKLDFRRVEIDLRNKPEWYAPKINPASKVPALVYGGSPRDSADDPSPESDKLSESYALVEFIADISDSDTLLPKDPVQRAKARRFIETATGQYTAMYAKTFTEGAKVNNLLDAVAEFQAVLAPTGYAIGEYSIADVAITPFLLRTELALKNDLGAFDEGTGIRAYETLQTDPKFERFRQYLQDVKARASYKKTFDEESVKSGLSRVYAPLRTKRMGMASAAA